MANRVQLTSDGHKAYLEAVEGAFGADVEYAQLVKLYGVAPESDKGRYSPAECIGARKHRVEGDPDPALVSTSYAERQNLTMRMHMRRFTRLTNAFSKKVENHMHMVAIYTSGTTGFASTSRFGSRRPWRRTSRRGFGAGKRLSPAWMLPSSQRSAGYTKRQ